MLYVLNTAEAIRQTFENADAMSITECFDGSITETVKAHVSAIAENEELYIEREDPKTGELLELKCDAFWDVELAIKVYMEEYFKMLKSSATDLLGAFRAGVVSHADFDFKDFDFEHYDPKHVHAIQVNDAIVIVYAGTDSEDDEILYIA